MQPKTAYRTINNIMAQFYREPIPSELPYKLKPLKTPKVTRALNKMLEKNIIDVKRICAEDGFDFHDEMYYPETLDNINSVCCQLFYISDRWNCIGRIKYIQEVLKRY